MAFANFLLKASLAAKLIKPTVSSSPLEIKPELYAFSLATGSGLLQAHKAILSMHALNYYQGALQRNLASTAEAKFRPDDKSLKNRVNRKHRARTVTGLGANWDRYALDRPLDGVQERWKN
jgi:hypothetical protein